MVEWNWDLSKDASNKNEHGLSLGDGVAVLDNDRHITLDLDERHYENRLSAIGSSDGGATILYIVYTVQEAENSDEEDYGRIISVRKATKDECEKYRNNIS